MCALVRHFGDVTDAGRGCGICDVCDPAGAVLRQFRRATQRERHWVQDVIEALRNTAYKTPKGLRTELPWAEVLERDDFEGLLGAMQRAGLIEVENAEFEKDGKVIPFRKFSLTDQGLEVRPTTPLALLFSDGIVKEFSGEQAPVRKRVRTSKPQPSIPSSSQSSSANPRNQPPRRAAEPMRGSEEPIVLEGQSAALAIRLKEWRATEAKRLGVPPFLVLHDRTLNELAKSRPRTPSELLGIEGMGPSKVGRFGAAILDLCCSS